MLLVLVRLRRRQVVESSALHAQRKKIHFSRRNCVFVGEREKVEGEREED